MILKAFSIYDSKAKVFHTPFFKQTPGLAERDFKQVTKDKDSMICQYPEDFDLYYLGDYDDQTGTYQSLDTPQHLVKAAQIKE